MPFEMDKWGVDVAMAGSQKGLMTPPGLSFTVAGPRAREAHKRANMRTPYGTGPSATARRITTNTAALRRSTFSSAGALQIQAESKPEHGDQAAAGVVRTGSFAPMRNGTVDSFEAQPSMGKTPTG